jgi:hypothetical protein
MKQIRAIDFAIPEEQRRRKGGRSAHSAASAETQTCSIFGPVCVVADGLITMRRSAEAGSRRIFSPRGRNGRRSVGDAPTQFIPVYPNQSLLEQQPRSAGAKTLLKTDPQSLVLTNPDQRQRTLPFCKLSSPPTYPPPLISIPYKIYRF